MEGGADRLEICANLGIGGGTTPSVGLVKCIIDTCPAGVKVMAMVRPRIGDFLYTDHEYKVMKEDIRQFKLIGVHGVVLGLLTSDGGIDVERTRTLVQLASDMGLEVCFHRAFDMVKDQDEALEQLRSIPGITRILTSGGVPNAPDALPTFEHLCRDNSNFSRSNTPAIMPGSGLNARTIPPLLRGLLPLGVRDVHLSGGEWVVGGMEYRKVGMGMGLASPDNEIHSREWSVWRTSREKVRAVRELCDQIWEEFMQARVIQV